VGKFSSTQFKQKVADTRVCACWVDGCPGWHFRWGAT